MPEIDSLDIKISAEASKADKAIDRLIGKLGKLSGALDFDTDITGINKQKQAFDSLGDTIKGISGTMDSLKKSMSGMYDAVAPQTQKLANTIARIATAGDKSEQAAKSLPKIGNALSKVTADMAGAKNIDSSINRFTSSIARLASAGDKSAVVSKELPKVGNALKDVANKMASVEGISDSTNSFTQAIAQLASAGDKAEKTAAGLDQLADGTLRFFNAMKGAPQISENTIRMTQAMAQLSSTGGRVSTSMKQTNTVFQTVSKSLNSLSNVAKKASYTIKKAMSGIAKVVSGEFSKIGQIGIKASNAMKRVAGDMAAAFARITHSSRGLNTASSNLKSLLKTILGFKGLQALWNFGKNALELGSDITEVENVVDTAFGSMAGHAYAFASTAKEQFGLSELAAKKYSGTMMAMLKSSGVAQKQAAIMSTTLAGLAGDIASFYNIETDEAFYKLRSAISGETEPMKQLGVNMNIVNLEAFAMSKGITKAYKDMTLAEQATLRYEYILAKTTDAQGDFAKTVGTYANQLRLLKLNIQSISAVIGQGLIAAILPAIKRLNALMSKLMGVAKAFRNFMYTITGFRPDKSGGGIVDDMAGVGDAADDLGDLGDAAEDAGKKIKKNILLLPFDELNVLSEASSDIADDLEDIGDIDTGLGDIGDFDKFDDSAVNEWAKKLRDAFLNQDWEGLGRIIAELINKGLEWLYKKIKQITPKVEKALKNLAKVINSFIKNLDWDLLGRTIGAGINLLTKAFNALFGDEGINIELLGEKLSTGLRGMIGEVDWRELGNAIGNYLMIAWRIAYGFIEDMWRIDPDTLLTGWSEAGNALGDTINGIFDRIDFEKISSVITEGFKGVLETITYMLNKIEFDSIVDKINAGLDRFYSGIKWDSSYGQDMGKKITAFTDSIANAFNKLLNLDIGKIGKIIGAGITDIVRAFNHLMDISGGIDFEKIGKKISDGLRGLVTEVPWEEFGNALGNGFMLSWRILDGFLNDMAKKSGAGLTGWQELGNGIADAINGLFDKVDLSKVARDIAKVFNGIVSTIQKAVDNIKWNDISKNISNGFNALIHGIDWSGTGRMLSDLATNLFGMIYDAAKNIDWRGIGEGIGKFIAEIDWKTIFLQIFNTITTVLFGLIDGLKSTVPGRVLLTVGELIASLDLAAFIGSKLIPILTTLFGPGGTIVGAIITAIIAAFPVLANMGGGKEAAEAFNNFAKNLFNKAVEVIKSIDWSKIMGNMLDFLLNVDWIGVITKIRVFAIELAGHILAGITEAFVSIIPELPKIALDLILGLANGIISVIGALGNAIKEIFLAIVDGIKSWFGIHSPSTVMFEIGTFIMQGLINGILSLFESVVVLVSSVANVIKGVWDGIGEFFANLWNGIRETAESAWNYVSEFLIGIWSGIKENVYTIWGDIQEFFGGLWNGMQETAQTVWTFISEFLYSTWQFISESATEIWGNIREIFTNVWNGVQETAEKVWSSIKGFLKGAWEGIFSTAKEIWNGIKDFFDGLWNGIQETAKSAWESISGFLSGTWNAIKDKAREIWDGVGDFIKTVWDGVSDVFHNVWDEIKGFLSDVWTGISDNAKEIWNKVKEFFTELWSGIQENAKNVWNDVKETLSDIWGKTKENAEKIWDGVKEYFANLWDGFKETSKSTWESIKETLSGIWGSIKENASSIWGSVKEFFSTVWDGFKEKNSSAWNSIKETLSGTWNNIKQNAEGVWGGMKDFFLTVWDGVGDGVASSFGRAIDGIKNVWNSFAGWLNDKLKFEIPPINIMGNQIFGGATIDLGKIPMFAAGGFPEDGLFMANHGELVGKFSNGQTAVANNEQIVKGIEEAAYRGFLRAQAETSPYLAEIARNTRETADKDMSVTIGDRDIVDAYDRGKSRNGFDFGAVPT